MSINSKTSKHYYFPKLICALLSITPVLFFPIAYGVTTSTTPVHNPSSTSYSAMNDTLPFSKVFVISPDHYIPLLPSLVDIVRHLHPIPANIFSQTNQNDRICFKVQRIESETQSAMSINNSILEVRIIFQMAKAVDFIKDIPGKSILVCADSSSVGSNEHESNHSTDDGDHTLDDHYYEKVSDLSRTQVIVIATCSSVIGTFFLLAAYLRFKSRMKRMKEEEQSVRREKQRRSRLKHVHAKQPSSGDRPHLLAFSAQSIPDDDKMHLRHTDIYCESTDDESAHPSKLPQKGNSRTSVHVYPSSYSLANYSNTKPNNSQRNKRFRSPSSLFVGSHATLTSNTGIHGNGSSLSIPFKMSIDRGLNQTVSLQRLGIYSDPTSGSGARVSLSGNYDLSPLSANPVSSMSPLCVIPEARNMVARTQLHGGLPLVTESCCVHGVHQPKWHLSSHLCKWCPNYPFGSNSNASPNYPFGSNSNASDALHHECIIKSEHKDNRFNNHGSDAVMKSSTSSSSHNTLGDSEQQQISDPISSPSLSI